MHLAARVHHPHEENAAELYHRINTEGTLHLARCAEVAGVRHFVFVSTVLVHGRTNEGRAPFNEGDTLTPRGAYGRSKAAAEAGLRALAQESDMRITIIRPPLIYGAGARGNFSSLIRAVKLGIPLPFGAIRNQRAYLSVQNLTSFISQRLTRADGKFDIFLLADDEQVSTPEFIRRLAVVVGATPWLFPVPPVILTALLKTCGQADWRDSLVGSLELDVSKAASTGWRPEISLDEGLRRAIDDCVES